MDNREEHPKKSEHDAETSDVAASTAAAASDATTYANALGIRTPPETHETSVQRPVGSIGGVGDAEGDSGDGGEESGEEDIGDIITAEEAADIVRIFLVASAVAVPQARWIGEQLMDPYGAKFQRQRLGIPFRKEVLGGLDDPEGRAWPEAAWNVHPSGRGGFGGLDGIAGWEGRHALRDCSDTPAYLPFAPLGEFLRHEGPVPSHAAAAAYITALQIAHTDIPGFVLDALDPDGEVSAGSDAQWGSADKP
eukprot:CAMPEP_0197578942 /NCGR_PEP_ID=MMETSP1326-20131121/3035_1 /TAXON_ID=1155430 /ORGANISM="Genus nov. species nov., Strain RCC2288" /LENGTH=250 /DNA_ID=CAMNT_0043142245 /DNA_START=36 /DNA_END=785 /DNA_ORIENTATION=+